MKIKSILILFLFLSTNASAELYALDTELPKNTKTIKEETRVQPTFFWQKSAEEIKRIKQIGCIYGNIFYDSGSEINQNGTNKICKRGFGLPYGWVEKPKGSYQ